MSASETSKRIESGAVTTSRREFSKVALGGAALLASAGTSSATLRPIPPGIKVGHSAGQPSPENMLFLKQLGVTSLLSKLAG